MQKFDEIIKENAKLLEFANDLAKSFEDRKKSMDFFYYSDPMVSYCTHLGKQHKLPDEEIQKLVICVLSKRYLKSFYPKNNHAS